MPSPPLGAAAAAFALLGTFAGCAAPSADLAGGAGAPPKPGGGWVQVAQNGEGTLFIDPGSVLRVGPSAFITLLEAKNGTAGIAGGSLRVRLEIDCDGKRVRQHDATSHGDRAALGPPLMRAGQGDWRDLPPDADAGFNPLARAVCANRGEPDPPAPAVPPPGHGRGKAFKA